CLGVRRAGSFVPSPAGDLALLVDDDTTDPRVGWRAPATVFAQRHCPGHQVALRAVHRRTSISRISAETPGAGTARRARPPPSRPAARGRPRLRAGSTARRAAGGWRAPPASRVLLRLPPVGTFTQTPRALQLSLD